MKKLFFLFSLLMSLTISTNLAWGDTVSDELSLTTTGVSGTSYTTWSGKTATSKAVYAGNSAGGNSSIQLRSNNNNSGVVTTASGGKAKRITVVWNSNTDNSRKLNIYGKNSAYSTASDLYNNNQGTLIGSVNYSSDATQLTISGDYGYIGFRSASGALYLEGVVIEWETTSTGGDDPVLESIAVTGTPTKTAYFVGQDFDPSGLIVTGTYSDDSTATISSGITWAYNPSQTLALNQTSIGVTATVSEIVSPELTVSGLSVTVAPAADSYEKITSAPNDWSGEYLIVYEPGDNKARVWTGIDAANCYVETDIDADAITQPEGSVSVTIASMEGGYSIALNGGTNSGKYIQNNGSSNGIKFVDAGVATTITYENGAVTLTCGGKKFRYNNASGNDRFRYFGSDQQVIQLYKKSDAITPKEDAGLAYAVANYLIKLGASFTVPTLTNPNSLTGITYASSDANVVAVNASTGELTIKAAGKAVITASRAEDNTYKAGSASYTIYVTAHAGTQTDPYTVADARLAIDKVGETGIADKYVSGIVSNVKSLVPSQFERAQYYISDDGERENELYIYNGYYLNGVAFTSVDQLMSGDDVVVKGKLLKYYNTTYEVDQNNQLISLNRTKTPAGLAYAVAEIEKNVEDAAFTNPLTNPNSLNITYNSSAENVATVSTNGEVTIVGIGTTTITASFAGDAVYLAGEAFYTLKVNDPSLTKVTFDATTDIATDNTEGVTKSGINIQTTHTDGVNDQSAPIAYYQTFKNQKLIVTSTVGNIKLIEFTTTGGASYAASGFEGVANNAWIGNASSVELTASGNQVRMSKIDVYYKADNRTEAGLEWSTDAIELTVGDAFTAPTLNNPNNIASADIAIASDNEDLATVSNGVVSLVANATGTATITATFEGNDDYKSATVNYTITVNAVGAVKNVVILAKYDGKWYALMNEVGSANNTLNALDVVYSESNGAILNLSAEEQAKIIWKRSISSNKATFKNGTNYITGASGNTNLTLAANECEWTIDGEHYVIGNRTILYYKAGYFKNYAVSNVGGSDYSDYIVVLEDPEFLTQTEIRDELIEGQWGTFCSAQEVKCPSGASFFTIAYANKQQNGVLTKVYFDEIGEGESLQAGKPYIYIANDNAIKGVLSGDAVDEGINDNGFVGVLSDFAFQVNSDATRNKYYVIYGNQIRLCADGYFKLLAGRAYIDAKDANLPTREVAAPAPGRRRIGLDNPAAPQVLTDIEATQTTGKAVKMMIGEQLFILRDGKLYDTTGRFITNMQ